MTPQREAEGLVSSVDANDPEEKEKEMRIQRLSVFPHTFVHSFTGPATCGILTLVPIPVKGRLPLFFWDQWRAVHARPSSFLSHRTKVKDGDAC